MMNIMEKVDKTKKTLWEKIIIYVQFFILLFISSIGGKYWFPLYFLPIICLFTVPRVKEKRVIEMSLLFLQIIILILMVDYIDKIGIYDYDFKYMLKNYPPILQIEKFNKASYYLGKGVMWLLIISPVIEIIIFMLMKRQKSIEMTLMFLHILFLYLLIRFIIAVNILPLDLTLIVIIGLLSVVIFKNIDGLIEKYIWIIGIESAIFILLLIRQCTIGFIYVDWWNL
jgi:hypothetical protein